MTSPTDSTSSNKKKRPGRKRLPPLAPGPRLQFVVASHPDDFKADKTMRHVRSHVMYKHRSQEGRSGSKSPGGRRESVERSLRGGSVTRTPSPMTASNSYLDSTVPDSTLWDSDYFALTPQSSQIAPLRSLTARIISALDQTQSAPPVFDEGAEYPFASSSRAISPGDSYDTLKGPYLDLVRDFYGDRSWMETVCSSRVAFLSHVSVVCVFQDLADRIPDDSDLTVLAKTKVLAMVQDSIQRPDTQTDDFTILSILHLLMSEVGGFQEDVFNMHQDGLFRIIHQRGGINALGLNGDLSSVVTLVSLCFATFRGLPEPPILHGFIPHRRPSGSMAPRPPISPLFCPGGDMSGLFGTLFCSNETYQLLCDMHELTQTFILRWGYVSDDYSASAASEIRSYDAHMQQIYTQRILTLPMKDSEPSDWVYECVRLTSLILCRSMLQGVPLSESASIVPASSSQLSMNLSPDSYVHDNGYTMLSALHNALENTDKTDCWGELGGVFLWICLLGGAACWQSNGQAHYGETDEMVAQRAWTRKCFALWTVKASLRLGFEQPAAVVESQRTMLQVQRLIGLKSGIRSQ